MSLYLTKKELQEATGFYQTKKQAAALAQLGYEFKLRPKDGFPLVVREAVIGQPTKLQKKREPDWNALRETG